MSWYLKYLHPVQTDLAAFPLSLPALAPALRILKSALDAITAATVTLDLQQDLLAVVDLAHRMMSSASSQSSYHWRRLHTDACIIRSVLMLESPTPLNAISSLDSAIIISGATGNDRLDLIQSLIRDIQSRYSSPHLFTDQLDRPLRAVKTSSRLESAALWVPQLDSQPSQLAFQTMYFKRPFVLRGYATEWPAMQEHPWRSASYLRSIAGAGRIVPVEVGFDYREDDWSQKLVSWDEFLSTLDLTGQLCSKRSYTEVMYLAQHNLFMQFPVLWADISIPDYVYADLDCSNHTPPRNDEGLVINIWLGPRGTVSPAHTDPYHNMYVQVVGDKTVWLAPPNISSWMYPYKGTASHPAVNDHDPQMSNTSRVNVFGQRTDTSEEECPDFWTEVVPRAMSYTLVAGDLLYIPAGWWHGMRSEDTSFSVSMWF